MQRLACMLLVVLAALAAGGCFRLSARGYDGVAETADWPVYHLQNAASLIKRGMTTDRVLNIAGKPDKMTPTEWHWRYPSDGAAVEWLTVTFKRGRVADVRTGGSAVRREAVVYPSDK